MTEQLGVSDGGASAAADGSIVPPVPFRVAVPEARLAWIRERVAGYRHFAPPADEGTAWRYGINSRWLERLCAYWIDGYSWRDAEALLNRYPQFLTTVDGIRIHYVVVRGEGEQRRPLLLLHGWPGSHFEFWKVADRLAFPSRHGGSAQDAFDLVIPSLPGYGFSGPTPRPVGMRTAARLLDRLMTDVLGHPHYMVQGGDWGAVVATWLGIDHADSCRAVHINLVGLRPAPDDDGAIGAAEQRALRAIIDRERPDLAYALQHATRPQTLAIGLMDSPVGTAAWILDKFHDWSQLVEDDIDRVYTRDELLTNVMIYLVNETMASSLWSYRGMAEERVPLSSGIYCASPTAIAHFPFERVGGTQPRTWVQRFYNVTRWTDFERGGHFAALEQPIALANDVAAFGRDAFPSASASTTFSGVNVPRT